MKIIKKVTAVSDGIVVEFNDDIICYFPAEALYTHRAELHAQTLLDYDPGTEAEYSKVNAASDSDDSRIIHQS